MSPVVEALSLNCWATREVPNKPFFNGLSIWIARMSVAH